jgi:aminoglycoside phosphotransferase (APT) family kinase protein
VADVAVEVRPGDELDWEALEAHLRMVVELPDEPMTVRQFVGGSANLTYLASFGPARLVVRRPPRGVLPPGAHDMAREHRVLSRLADVYARAPRALHHTDDPSIIGAPFLVIEHRDGVVIRDALPEGMRGHADVERRVDLALVDAAADLHTVDPAAAGLAELGRPDGFGRRQVEGWHDRWRRAAPDDGPPAMDDIAARLAATLPEPVGVAIVHNDLKLDNCQFQVDDPDTVTSVFDWDMATLGDPLFDLGLLLVSMVNNRVWVLSAEDAVERYASRSGIDVRGIDWYVAFATWRTAIVLQQLCNRYAAGDSTDPRVRTFFEAIPACAQRAWELVR